MQLYRCFMSQSSEFCRHTPLYCFLTSVSCCLFRHQLSPEAFQYTLICSAASRTCRRSSPLCVGAASQSVPDVRSPSHPTAVMITMSDTKSRVHSSFVSMFSCHEVALGNLWFTSYLLSMAHSASTCSCVEQASWESCTARSVAA
jgi:hypothetical protein